MANIAIINYCNLTCPYCFANRYITEEEKQVITMEQLEHILEFLGRCITGRVGIIGGEPTIHPQFSTILERMKKFCIDYNTRCTIFTNGIHLHEYARSFDNNINCLLNLNHPEILGDSKWQDTLYSLNRMNLCSNMERVNFGINLYPDMLSYDYIFELAEKYNKDNIRVSYVAPTCQFANVIDKDNYYEEAKEIFIPFVEESKRRGVRIRLDCNHIPRCYFTEEQLSFIDTVVEGFHDYCDPVVDITPDFQGTACFGAYELIDLHKFNNILEVERYLRFKKLYPLTLSNCSGKCKECSKHENLSCQGGCLAFSNNQLN